MSDFARFDPSRPDATPDTVKKIRETLGFCPDCGRDHRAEVQVSAALNGLKLLPEVRS